MFPAYCTELHEFISKISEIRGVKDISYHKKSAYHLYQHEFIREDT